MKPFEKKEYYKPNLLEKLSKNIPKRNFLIDLNNLLSESRLDSLNNIQISQLASKYEINPYEKFGNEMRTILKEYLQENLINDGYLHAVNFQELLGIDNDNFLKIYHPIALELIKKKVGEILKSSRTYSEVEETQIQQFREFLNIPEEESEKIINECRVGIVQAQFNQIVEDGRVSPDELAITEKLSNDLQVNASLDEKSKQQIEKFKWLWKIENADLPLIEPDILMPKSEKCYFICAVNLYENRKITKRVGYAGPTLRVKIIKGVYFRAGNVGINRQTEDVLTKIDEGILYVTNKRILFRGGKQNKVIRYHQIIDLVPFKDGLEITKESGRSPLFEPFTENIEVLTATIARVMKDSGG